MTKEKNQELWDDYIEGNYDKWLKDKVLSKPFLFSRPVNYIELTDPELKEFCKDTIDMQKHLLEKYGIKTFQHEVASVWYSYSDGFEAGWMTYNWETFINFANDQITQMELEEISSKD